MKVTYVPGAQVRSDGVTVWVDTDRGTVARFGRLGIDVHTADTSECLYCTHGPTDTVEQWRTFVDRVLLHHNVEVDDGHMPVCSGWRDADRVEVPEIPG
jgi:hypothetical protein